MLLKDAQLRNTPWCFGSLSFPNNATTVPPIKSLAVERQVNGQIALLFIVFFALSVGSSIATVIRLWLLSDKQRCLTQESADSNVATFAPDILIFVILYNNLISIARIVTKEVVKYQQAQFISSDLDMYYAKNDIPALCWRSGSVVGTRTDRVCLQ
ncbi:hypothetical protein M422DRAFT_32157 [Sphaerobolus stellatus SS14]|uniref:Uncharacterized protein n=1 Tax=Sphaerobolus stellatus (strain SS14) TaxID=990650 RepID=A0A0C9V0Y0_SPHS4|nr:hypothetical protein M422DRAFT_32157 [Sphaerobolus stellatus SS14]